MPQATLTLLSRQPLYVPCLILSWQTVALGDLLGPGQRRNPQQLLYVHKPRPQAIHWHFTHYGGARDDITYLGSLVVNVLQMHKWCVRSRSRHRSCHRRLESSSAQLVAQH